MIKILKALNTTSEFAPTIGDEKKFTRFESVKDLVRAGEDAQLTRFDNSRVRETLGIKRKILSRRVAKPAPPIADPEPVVEPISVATPAPIAEPEPVILDAPIAAPAAAPETIIQPDVVHPAPRQSEVPISLDTIRSALPQRFAALNSDASETGRIAD